MTSSSPQVLPIKRKVLAAVATLTIACGVGAAATGVASAASPQCADRCISVFSSELGSYDQLNFVEAILGDGGARIGQPVGLKPANKFDPTQDIKPDGPFPYSTVADFFAAGMVSAEANQHYGHLQAVQQKYAPFDIDTDLCVGLASVKQNEGLTLQPCSVPGTTVWVVQMDLAPRRDTSPSSTPRPPTSAARSRCTCRETKSRAASRCRCRPAVCSSSVTRRRSGRGSSGARGPASCPSKPAVPE